MLFKSIC